MPRFFWIVIPCLFLVMQVAIELFVPEVRMDALHSESGPHEFLQAIIMFLASLLALRVLLMAPSRETKIWVLLALLGSVYTFGEEISWGQHVFDWATPDYWLRVNDQQETNLHNTSAWLDQKPRILLEIGVITGGLIIPWLQRNKAGRLPARFAAIYPTQQLALTAALYAAVKLGDMVLGWFDHRLFWRSSEVEELYMFYFVLLYLVVLYQRFKSSAVQSS